MQANGADHGSPYHSDPDHPVEEEAVPLPAEGIQAWKVDTAYREDKHLVRFGEGRQALVSSRMLDLIEALDGERSLHGLAQHLTQRWGQSVAPAQIRQILDKTLEPLGLVQGYRNDGRPASESTSGGSLPGETGGGNEQGSWKNRKKRPTEELFGHRFRFTLIPVGRVRDICPHLERLYAWPVALGGLLAVLVSRVLMYGAVDDGLLETFDATAYLYTFVLVLLTVVVHELGHATAVSRWGGEVGEVGFTLYFVYPALYTDTSGSWRFDRWRRVAVDLGGAYFQLLVSVPLAVLFVTTGEPILFFTCASIDSLLFFSLNPFFKFDGYWMISDLIGVPNLHKHGLLSVRQSVAGWLRRRRAQTDPPDAAQETSETPGLSRWSHGALLVYGGCLYLFIGLVIYLTFAYGVGWVLAFPERATRVLAETRQGMLVDRQAATGHLLRLFYETAATAGLVIFWARLPQMVWQAIPGTRSLGFQGLKERLRSVGWRRAPGAPR